MARQNGDVLSEHVMELRYQHNGRVLDHRGEWAEIIRSHMALPHWQITQDRIDIFDRPASDTKMEKCFATVSNAGYVLRNASTLEQFYQRAIKLAKLLTTLDGFDAAPLVRRIGVRSRTSVEADLSFEQLVSAFSANYIAITPKAEAAIKARLVDTGAPLNFVDDIGNFNTACGPMESKQIREFFKWAKQVPEVGLYYDVDYWIRPDRQMDAKSIGRSVEAFARAGGERTQQITRLILGA